MKLPYREGDSFALPLGDGTAIAATIRARDHHVVTIEAGGSQLRVYDSALVLRRWRPSTSALRAYAQDDTLANATQSPARAERLFAQACGVARFAIAPVRIFEVPADPGHEWFTRLPGDAVLAWNQTLGARSLNALLAWLGGRTGTRIRVGGSAVAQLGMLAGSPVAEVTLAAAPDFSNGHVFPAVRRLTVDAVIETAWIADAFPALSALRFGDGAHDVDAAVLCSLTALEEIDLAHVTVREFEKLSRCGSLRALRLAHLDGVRSVEMLTGLSLQTLAIENQPRLADARAIGGIATLGQLELRGMWQWSIQDCEWVFDMPSLLRASVDIGGRRKNVELYARARWAYPWPSFSDARVTSTAPLERSG